MVCRQLGDNSLPETMLTYRQFDYWKQTCLTFVENTNIHFQENVCEFVFYKTSATVFQSKCVYKLIIFRQKQFMHVCEAGKNFIQKS